MSQTYPRVRLTPELSKFWKEALRDLSPEQIEKGLLAWIKSERGNFQPTPAEIIGHAPVEAKDKLRVVADENCPDCHGTSWRQSESGKGVRRCDCRRAEYQGTTFQDPPLALPPVAEEQDKAVVNKLARELPEIKSAAKLMPGRRELSQMELEARNNKMLRDLEAQTKGRK